MNTKYNDLTSELINEPDAAASDARFALLLGWLAGAATVGLAWGFVSFIHYLHTP